MKLGRTITKKTPLALFARKSGLSYKQIAECTNQSESSLKKAAAGSSPLPPKAALAIANRFEVALPFLLGEVKGEKVLHSDGEEWHPFGGSAPGTVSGHSKEHNRKAIIQAIEACAAVIQYTLPKDDGSKARIGYALWRYNPFFTDADIAAMKTNTVNRQQTQESFKEVKKIYEVWNRENKARKKSEQINLAMYFESKFQTVIQGYPGEARKDLMVRLESLLVRAGRHPQSPLIAIEILRFLIEIEHRYKISRHRA